jgi:uncharacterized Rmd1/YagE family protein
LNSIVHLDNAISDEGLARCSNLATYEEKIKAHVHNEHELNAALNLSASLGFLFASYFNSRGSIAMSWQIRALGLQAAIHHQIV